ncbi:MAG: DUF924 domain-containing protein [Novosphingobium sp.]|nr:DUF924 domain-containing protein [Novosphingobium sp.]
MAGASRRWAAELLQFWFCELAPEQYWRRDAALDAEIVRRFLPDWSALRTRPAEAFLGDRETARAAVLLFDQVPRNAFRDDPRAYSSDDLARAIASGALERGWDQGLTHAERQFLYMPFMHSEAIADQDRSVALFAALGDRSAAEFAERHRAMIARFGRFPHRNARLGRTSSPAELAAIAAGNAW